jgi:hypothetical protein
MADRTPTLAGYIAFCRGVAGITTTVMPDDSPGFADTLLFAQHWIPKTLLGVDCYLYTAAVYNWGASLIIQYQPDQDGQTFFRDARAKFLVGNMVPGVISSTADEATSTTLTVGDALSNLTLIDLQRAKDPYGRQALAILMSMGPLWGLS